jgi:hypothetical protein
MHRIKRVNQPPVIGEEGVLLGNLRMPQLAGSKRITIFCRHLRKSANETRTYSKIMIANRVSFSLYQALILGNGRRKQSG